MLLNHMAKISQRGARLDSARLGRGILGDANQPLGVWCDSPTHHDAGIAMPAIFDHCDIDINDVAVAELFIVRGMPWQITSLTEVQIDFGNPL